MKVLVWGINYAPELTGIAPCNTALCEYLCSHGHDVRMVTTFAYYPAWRKLPVDNGKLFRTDNLNNVPVHRCWHYVPQKVTSLKRIIHEGSFVLTSFLRILSLPRADVMVVVSPPLLLGTAAWMAGLLKRSPFVFHVQDLQPDAAVGLGMLKPGMLIRALYALERFAYRHAARVSGISDGMIRAFHRKRVASERCLFFPNSIELPCESEIPSRGKFRTRQGLHLEDFLVMYSGNLGMKQGLEIIIDAARLVMNPRVKFIICGDGNQRARLAELVAENKLSNVLLLTLQPELEYRELLADSDMCLITQQAGAGGFFFPSKLLSALAWRRPILSVADDDSELAIAVKEGQFGVNILPGQPENLAAAVSGLADGRGQLPRFATAGRNYVSRFEKNSVLAQFEKELIAIIAESR